MTEALLFLAGVITGATLALVAVRQGSSLATRAYLGAFPPATSSPVSLDSSEASEHPSEGVTGVMGLNDLGRTTDGEEQQATLDATYLGPTDEEPSPDNWKQA